jgi:hypothetical protein
VRRQADESSQIGYLDRSDPVVGLVLYCGAVVAANCGIGLIL